MQATVAVPTLPTHLAVNLSTAAVHDRLRTELFNIMWKFKMTSRRDGKLNYMKTTTSVCTSNQQLVGAQFSDVLWLVVCDI